MIVNTLLAAPGHQKNLCTIMFTMSIVSCPFITFMPICCPYAGCLIGYCCIIMNGCIIWGYMLHQLEVIIIDTIPMPMMACCMFQDGKLHIKVTHYLNLHNVGRPYGSFCQAHFTPHLGRLGQLRTYLSAYSRIMIFYFCVNHKQLVMVFYHLVDIL